MNGVPYSQGETPVYQQAYETGGAPKFEMPSSGKVVFEIGTDTPRAV
jgi:hypothetical protein